MKTLRMTVSVLALILASVAPSSAQATVFVNGNTTFTVTWSGSVGGGATLLAQSKFTVSNWTGSSFVITVDNVKNTMPTSPNINARLTAFGFGLMPDGTFSSLISGSIYQWAFTNFPAFQRVDICLTSGGTCAGGGAGGLNQGQSSSETYSITITGNFANGVTVVPIPAKFQTSLGSLETDGVVLDPPPSTSSDLTIEKHHSPGVAIPGGTVTYTVTVNNVGFAPSSGPVTVTETPPPGLTVTALAGSGWTCTVATRTCTRSDALAAGAAYPPITVTTSVSPGATSGTVTNTVVVSGGGDSNTTNNTDTDPTVIQVPAAGMDLTIRKTHSPQTVAPGQTFTYFIAVLNVGGSPSSGTVTVVETPPAGLTVTALAGPGWICTVATRTCTRSDALAPAASYPDISVTTSVGAGVAPGTVTNTAVVSGGGDPNPANNTATDPTVITSIPGGPHLTMTKAAQGQGVVVAGQTVTFTIRVMNVGDAPTFGTVAVAEAPPQGLSVTALSGTGWSCITATLTCLRNDPLSPAGSYPDITVTAVVAVGTVAGTMVNGAAVSGGGDSNPGGGSAVSPIEIGPAAPGSDLALTKTRTGAGTLMPGQPVTFTLRMTNVGGSPTSGTVTVTETPPSGLTVTALSGSGWTCVVASRTCTRADALAPSASYPDITVTANIAVDAVGTLVNSAVVSGGGDTSPDNNTGTSPITISPIPVPVLPVLFVIALMIALFAIALVALRGRRVAGL